ncbi:RpiB/LacA/LacB family sugar-phosphate isomerase [Candidatus Woesearchaeota archaeon]|nr:RpiB/LacA/LacB family sugar-phosphate isomerase [Candidatus Woesearchaeota archaeon]
MKKPVIVLGTDHAGFKLKEEIKRYLKQHDYIVIDEGAYNHDANDDYPDFILPAARKVAKIPGSRGIIFGGSGQGEAIVANKVKGIRAALYYGKNPDIVRLSRTHNKTNILSLGARFLAKDEAIKAVKLWLGTEFNNEERHKRRINKISQIDK